MRRHRDLATGYTQRCRLDREPWSLCCKTHPPAWKPHSMTGGCAQGPGGRYQLISKSKAKDEYLLTDRQLDGASGGLGCIKVPNPNDARFGDMSLYLRTQARRRGGGGGVSERGA
eukprot:1106271-Pleurochrysis_carterae.AAC.1